MLQTARCGASLVRILHSRRGRIRTKNLTADASNRYILQDVISVVTKSYSHMDEQRKRKREEYPTDEDLDPDSVLLELPVLNVPQTPLNVGVGSTATYTSNQSSPASSSLQSDFPFPLPVHADELGQLPVWPESHDVVFRSTSSMDNSAWPATNSGSIYAESEGLLGVAWQPQSGFDPELEAIFANIFPDAGYGDFPLFPSSNTGTMGFDAPSASGGYDMVGVAPVPQDGAYSPTEPGSYSASRPSFNDI